MFRQILQIVLILAALLAGRLIVRRIRGALRDIAFAALNLGGLYLLFFYGEGSQRTFAFFAYVALAVIQYLTLRFLVGKTGWRPWVAFFTPLLALGLVRYIPTSASFGHGLWILTPYFLGISYLAFRCSLLVLEIRNGSSLMPGFFRYLGFCFFVPTMPVGPINSYGNYRRAFDGPAPLLPAGESWLRILIGLVKYKFIGNICFQLTYTNLLFDDHYHPWIDLPVAMIFYYLYLYCNFSGFCDMAIGAAAFMGIPVPENFNNPFAARNVRDFWNRWHITLSVWMRDIVFAPLSKFFVRWFGGAHVNHAIALTIALVFLLIGVWHGVGWNFVLYGAAHALAVVSNHYYTIFLKRRLSREGFKAYNENRLIRAIAVFCTFCFCAASMILFANSLPQIREMFSTLRP